MRAVCPDESEESKCETLTMRVELQEPECETLNVRVWG